MGNDDVNSLTCMFQRFDTCSVTTGTTPSDNCGWLLRISPANSATSTTADYLQHMYLKCYPPLRKCAGSDVATYVCHL
eukprot:gene6466-9342_t